MVQVRAPHHFKNVSFPLSFPILSLLADLEEVSVGREVPCPYSGWY